MKVDMLVDAGPSHPSQVCAKIEPLRLAYFSKGADHLGSRCHDVGVFFLRKIFKIGSVLVRNNHQVPAIVRIPIHHDKTMFFSHNDKICGVGSFLDEAAKQALFVLLFFSFKRSDVLRSPRRKHSFHDKSFIVVESKYKGKRHKYKPIYVFLAKRSSLAAIIHKPRLQPFSRSSPRPQ